MMQIQEVPQLDVKPFNKLPSHDKIYQGQIFESFRHSILPLNKYITQV